MQLGIRLLFAFFLLNGLLAFFVLRVFSAEIKPSVREVMEDMLVDTANMLAELATDDLANGEIANGRFASQVKRYASRPIDAKIWGFEKQSLDFRVYVTDAKGIVLFDSENNTAVGQDYSRWRDVLKTLKGEYGARSTREVKHDDKTTSLFVAAPIVRDDKVIGVLTVAKPVQSIQVFIDRAERKLFLNGLLLLALSAAVGVAVTLWTVWNVRKLRAYAHAVGQTDAPPLAVPDVPGELGELARAMQAMRQRLEGRDTIEAHVRALTHELKTPIAAIRASGELLGESLNRAQREQFAQQVVSQSERLQRVIDRLLELSKLEQRAVAGGLRESAGWGVHALGEIVQSAIPSANASRVIVKADSLPMVSLACERELVALAISNLIENALDFSPSDQPISVEIRPATAAVSIAVQDQGPGVPDYALPRLGERFYTTPRPESAAQTAHRKGSGLGLAIVKQIAALHGGTLTLENSKPGLRATLSLPTTKT
jgi:two-component system, OmpR family, sensor histidine kinase CreC